MPITCKLVGINRKACLSANISANTIETPQNISLGNHLFQIASTIGIAKMNNLSASFPEINKFKHHWGEAITNSVFRNLNKNRINIEHQWANEVNCTCFYNVKCEDNTKIVGYLQSYKYFDFCRDDILKIFETPYEIKTYIFNKYCMSPNTVSISVHIRRGDYLSEKCELNDDYYARAITFVVSKIQTDYKIFICSDDIEWCKTHILNDKCIYVENEETHIDLYIMSLCDHNIISNSTFSWWSAYLNQNNEKIVVYPKKWGSMYTHDVSDLLPDSWIEI